VGCRRNATLANWAANFVVSAAFPVLLGVVGEVYLVFAVICFLSIAFTIYLVPETRAAASSRSRRTCGPGALAQCGRHQGRADHRG